MNQALLDEAGGAALANSLPCGLSPIFRAEAAAIPDRAHRPVGRASRRRPSPARTPRRSACKHEPPLADGVAGRLDDRLPPAGLDFAGGLAPNAAMRPALHPRAAGSA